jgi:hypothetical protein
MKKCEVCHEPINDGDEIVAAMVTIFRQIPSEVIYAVDKPTDCLAMIHFSCYQTGEENED